MLDKMRMHLISKNVAADIAEQICDGVGKSLEGKSKSSFSKIANVVQSSIEETLTSILSPKRRVDILRDIIATKKQRRPYVIVFCGVNGESLCLVRCGSLLGPPPSSSRRPPIRLLPRA